MKSKAAASFWKSHDSLPANIRRLALKNFRLWRTDPYHPSLHFKRFKENYWSARVGDHYRAVGYLRNRQTFVWIWIGTHEDYSKL